MSSSSLAPSYAAVLRTRHACRTSGAALLGRLSYGMLSLAGVLAVKKATNSYAAAGTVMALFWLTSVFLSPTRAALIDRHGARHALPPMATAYAMLLAALASTTSRRGTSVVLLSVIAMAAGATTPPLGPVMRTLWSRLVPDPRLRQRAYSLDAVAEELLLVIGPLLVGLLIRVAVPSVALATCAALVLVGSLALASSPPVRGENRFGRPSAPAGDAISSSATSVSSSETSARRRPPLQLDPGLRQAIAVSSGMGMCLGALDLLLVAFFDEHHRPGAVAWALAALSAGSAIGGLAYGAVPWRSSSRLRLSLLAAALGLTLAASGLSPHPYVLIAWVGVGGLFIAPSISTAYLIADESASPAARTRAGAWVNTAFNAGSAGAAAATGWLVDRIPLSLCFALAAAPAVLSAATVLGRPHRPVAGASPPEDEGSAGTSRRAGR
ncbi:MFS transporter [Streptomyces sp. B15]|uniref:MFS transporter n=1 Tax=Streptomyces sp. B15 TaxID=1537797 RepID=UPI001B36A3EA|nr:MFS transporter [Streptomyces sp. B15]MBQ1123952.1 MFS transporter [Streptomyces sp. B15]